jgi:hypothetical protein
MIKKKRLWTGIRIAVRFTSYSKMLSTWFPSTILSLEIRSNQIVDNYDKRNWGRRKDLGVDVRKRLKLHKTQHRGGGTKTPQYGASS